MPTILYLHGFLSSPQSEKVRILREAIEKENKSRAEDEQIKLIAPDLNHPPRCVDTLLSEIAECVDLSDTAVIGSSLGGFWATRFAKRYGVRAVLLNPCFDPWSFIPDFIGEQKVYGTERVVEVKPEFEKDFIELDREVPAQISTLQPVLTLISLQDEVLPWRKTYEGAEGSERLLLTGEDHRITGFADWVDRVLAFALGN